LKIAVVVHGRFHSFNLVRALLQRGCDVTVLTNYPKWAAAGFGVPKDRVRSFWFHGVMTRVVERLGRRPTPHHAEAWLHSLFGRWAARQLKSEQWDVAHLWSGVAEESLKALGGAGTLRMVMRGSAHVRAQARLLREEEERTGIRQDRPSGWMIAREEREYALAEGIVVLSSFAHRTFADEGVPLEKLHLVPLGASLRDFRPVPEVIRVRQRRLLAGAPLRVLYVGALSFRKGLWDLARVVRELGGENFEFRLVGAVAPEARGVVSELRGAVTLPGKRPQSELPGVYAWGDVFVFPTIEDGYAVVLAQAAASALPIVTTSNCSGPDLVQEGGSGWVVPIRNPGAVVERLRWCEQHRRELAAVVEQVYEQFQPRDWSDVAADFEAVCLGGLQSRCS
jgi:glycosyltransferase involved in cell wall biosynthesis